VTRISCLLSRRARGLPLLAVVLAGKWLVSCMQPPPPRAEGGEFVVEVVDAKGTPLVDAEVEGLVDVNPGPVASMCCIQKRFAIGRTSERGQVTLKGAPFTFRTFHFRASFGEWVPREVTASSLLLHRNTVIRIVLGPKRDVRGRVDLGPNCPLPPQLEVHASPPSMRATVAADGSFVFNGLAPWAFISVYACNRGARVDLQVGDDSPIVLALPPAETP